MVIFDRWRGVRGTRRGRRGGSSQEGMARGSSQPHPFHAHCRVLRHRFEVTAPHGHGTVTVAVTSRPSRSRSRSRHGHHGHGRGHGRGHGHDGLGHQRGHGHIPVTSRSRVRSRRAPPCARARGSRRGHATPAAAAPRPAPPPPAAVRQNKWSKQVVKINWWSNTEWSKTRRVRLLVRHRHHLLHPVKISGQKAVKMNGQITIKKCWPKASDSRRRGSRRSKARPSLDAWLHHATMALPRCKHNPPTPPQPTPPPALC